MGKYYKSFSIDGVANKTVDDVGIVSTETEKKKIIALILTVSAYVDNIILGMLERDEILSLPDRVCDTYGSTASTNTQLATTKTTTFEINEEIEMGQTFKVAIKCGGTPSNLRGAYIYEVLA